LKQYRRLLSFALLSFVLVGCASDENINNISSNIQPKYIPTGEIVIQPQFASVGDFEDGMAEYSTRPSDAPLFVPGDNADEPLKFNFTKDLSGFITSTGKILPPVYKSAYYFREGVSPVEAENGRWGVIDKQGKWTIEPIYEYLSNFSNGLAYFQKTEKGKFGYINQKGEVVIEPIYDQATEFSEERALVCKSIKNYDDSTCGFIDTNRNEITEQTYSLIHSESFSEGLAMVCSGKGQNLRCGYINLEGKIVWELSDDIYEDEFGSWRSMLGSFSNGLALVGGRWFDDNIQKWGFINKDFETIIEPILGKIKGPKIYFDPYDFYGEIQWQTVGASKDSKGEIAAMNTLGEIQFFSTYEAVRAFQQGLSAVKVNGKWGYINEKNEMVIEPQFEDAREFSEGYAAIRLNGKWGFIK
jgi:hypothetical protein